MNEEMAALTASGFSAKNAESDRQNATLLAYSRRYYHHAGSVQHPHPLESRKEREPEVNEYNNTIKLIYHIIIIQSSQ